MPIVPAPRVPRLRAAARAAVVSVCLLLGIVLSGCEYEYEEAPWEDDSVSPAASAVTVEPAQAVPQQAELPRPVYGADLEDWVDEVLHDDDGRVLHTGSGTVDAGARMNETTARLSPGSYSLIVACRSTERVAFTVRDGDTVLLDLSLRCGTSSVSPLFLTSDAALTFEVSGRATANYACLLKGT